MFDARLSESQIEVIKRLAAPLQRADRERFRNRVAELLAGYSELGDGLLHRVARQAQHDVMTVATPPPKYSKWARGQKRAGAE
jgi:hypothetical protein